LNFAQNTKSEPDQLKVWLILPETLPQPANLSPPVTGWLSRESQPWLETHSPPVKRRLPVRLATRQ
jgi:hypothetical protein